MSSELVNYHWSCSFVYATGGLLRVYSRWDLFKNEMDVFELTMQISHKDITKQESNQQSTLIGWRWLIKSKQRKNKVFLTKFNLRYHVSILSIIHFAEEWLHVLRDSTDKTDKREISNFTSLRSPFLRLLHAQVGRGWDAVLAFFSSRKTFFCSFHMILHGTDC